jgi:DUF4097 and DUF4098 domain-containing protein YvlB
MKILFYSVLAWSMTSLCHADWAVRDQATIEKSLTLKGAAGRVVIENVNGYVHVKGVSGSEVHMIAHKVIRAKTDSDLALARQEVKLDVTEEPGQVSIRYDSPSHEHGDNNRHYDVSFDIDVEVPAGVQFDTGNVNGSIQMSGMEGSGTAHTVNGSVNVRFARNPATTSSFKSINGSLDVWFQQNLAAEMTFKTLNGQVYADFDVEPRAIPAAALTEHRDDGKFVYRSNGMGGGRVGSGGPEISFDTVNGSIRLHKEQ